LNWVLLEEAQCLPIPKTEICQKNEKGQFQRTIFQLANINSTCSSVNRSSLSSTISWISTAVCDGKKNANCLTKFKSF